MWSASSSSSVVCIITSGQLNAMLDSSMDISTCCPLPVLPRLTRAAVIAWEVVSAATLSATMPLISAGSPLVIWLPAHPDSA